MLQKRSPIGIKSLIIVLCLLLQYSCIEPVPAIFDYKEDLIIIDAVASTAGPGLIVCLSVGVSSSESEFMNSGSDASACFMQYFEGNFAW